jgi:20S proteasome alpha/beta subunit
MITAGDIKYEPNQRKRAEIFQGISISVAGDYAYSSAAMARTYAQAGENPSVETVATLYGQAIQNIKRKEAEDLYLAPLGLNTDTFIAQQREMSESFVSTLREQMQNHRSEEVAALIVGCQIIKDKRVIRIFEVNTHGMVSCHDDVGFAAIGSGAWHAKSRLMQSGYVSTLFYPAALGFTFAAAKAAEVAPGVGSEIDIAIVFEDHVEALRPDLAEELPKLYKRYAESSKELTLKSVYELRDFIAKLPGKIFDGQGIEITKPDAKTDGGLIAATPEAPPTNEAGPKAIGAG